MVLITKFNLEPEKIYNVRELHVYFDKENLQLVIDGQQLTHLWRNFSQIDFPNQDFVLTIRNSD